LLVTDSYFLSSRAERSEAEGPFVLPLALLFPVFPAFPQTKKATAVAIAFKTSGQA
jgi:hypothetical protein